TISPESRIKSVEVLFENQGVGVARRRHRSYAYAGERINHPSTALSKTIIIVGLIARDELPQVLRVGSPLALLAADDVGNNSTRSTS
ncbi:MAG: hypothetical protein ACYTXY_27465, partial [Nostoc sp.]